ncbi:DUF4389 domain-containing protein [Sansalvadorimonas sp. 2012CJ34-2]|uniref:DUF4389 domain-containing protein n=1 Tax=Parendozoicomonas callyspongiae TaxID=2942213 RepID=A0ABT0PD33_9GAMM|nr:DUF4389 domain-containing protein [Sansalvadorimonas sp. 2012CJ34-2]MCL6268657.1 DUF4389 domain-containing protein [Sansalvadorimonas sp. 2012CJ34-2]
MDNIDKQDVKKNLMSESAWIRLIYMVLFWLAGHLVVALVLFVAVIQAVITLLSGSPNANLLDFTKGLNRYLYQIAGFLTFNSELKPYPFSDWPADVSENKSE